MAQVISRGLFRKPPNPAEIAKQEAIDFQEWIDKEILKQNKEPGMYIELYEIFKLRPILKTKE